jgi:hypothetical protein
LPKPDVLTELISPTLRSVATLASAAVEDVAQTITWQALMDASGAADPGGDALSFRISAVLGGGLTLNGQPVVAGQTLLAQGQALVWTPPQDANGSVDAFEVSAFDGRFDSPVGKVVLTLSPTADAIAAKAPDVVTAIAGQAVVFSLAAGTGFSVKAPDLSGSDQVAVRLDVIGGRSSLLLAGSDSGLTWTDADGADGSLAFSGSLDAVNAALAAGVRASVEVGKVRLSVSDQIGQSAAVATVKGGLGAQTGQYIIGDGSGGGGQGWRQRRRRARHADGDCRLRHHLWRRQRWRRRRWVDQVAWGAGRLSRRRCRSLARRCGQRRVVRGWFRRPGGADKGWVGRSGRWWRWWRWKFQYPLFACRWWHGGLGRRWWLG